MDTNERLQQDVKELKRRITEMATTNAHAAEIVAELEQSKAKIQTLNERMAQTTAEGAELLAEIEQKNKELARAAAMGAELTAEVELQQEQLEQQNERLQELNDEKNRFLGIAAHDIRNGIAIIDMQTDLVLKIYKDLEPKAIEALTKVRKHCKTLTSLVNDTLDVSRIDEGKMDPNFREESLAALAMEIAELFRIAAESKGQTFITDIPKDLPPVLMDHGMIGQVISNFISNAIKFTPADGRITVRTGQKDDQLFVAVSDTGPGLTEEDLRMAFGTFCKLSAQPTAGEKSHGLGLAITKKLITIHNGTIGAENNADGGATFQFSIPLKQPG